MKHLFIFTMLLLSGQKAFSQDGNLRFIHFADYNEAKDKIVQEELKGEKVTYTCIPSGILAIEISPDDPRGEARIAKLLSRKISQTGKFEFVSITLETAKSSCSTYRLPE